MMKGKEVNFNIITKSLLDQDMHDILEQFFKLEDSLDNPDEHIQEWLIIKLVTIIEQFCREIVKNQIDDNPDIQLPPELHITVAKLDSAKKISTSSLIASQYNFQNMQTIINELKHYKIDGFLKDVNKNDLDELFRIRHDIIHTISSTQNYNVENGYTTIQNLLKKILEKSTCGTTYYDITHGLYFGSLEKYDKSINCFTNAIKINFEDISAHYYIGVINYIENNSRKVYDRSATMIHLNPKHRLGYYLQGLSFELQEKYEDAVTCYDKAIKMKPDFALAYYKKYTMLLPLNKNEEAERCRKIAIEMEPDGNYPSVSNDEKKKI